MSTYTKVSNASAASAPLKALQDNFQNAQSFAWKNKVALSRGDCRR